jgi:hypothetical protein
MAGRQRVLSGFAGAGIDPEDAVLAYRAIIHFTLAVLLDSRHGAGSGYGASTGYGGRALRDLFASQDPERFPDVVAQAERLARYDADAEFTFGLTTLIYGIERLTGRAGRAGRDM